MTDQTLEFRWTVSRARDTYGYNICALWVDGRKAAACNGGGYDMKGTSLGMWIARAYADRLRALKPEQMDEQSHWELAAKPRRYCPNASCGKFGKHVKADVAFCGECHSETHEDRRDGKRVNDGHYFYGLTFHDPNFDPGKAMVGTDCDDRTIGQKSEGKTVAESEAAGESFGLERYQAVYAASSKVPTERHTIPSIDGACGIDAVMRIMKSIGLTMVSVRTRSKSIDIHTLHDQMAAKEDAA